VVTADISSGSRLQLVPVVAPASANHLAPLDKIAALDGRNLIAGRVRAKLRVVLISYGFS
jgi:hypothetical protein